jgi:RHS repeat-associated protein
MTRDDYHSLSLQYNSFNLPWELDFGNNKKVSYFYSGGGQKLTKWVETGTGAPVVTEYLGPFVHQYNMGSTSSLKYIITPEGRIKNTGTNAAPVWSWEYNLTDHLGNVRVVFRPSGTSTEVMDYNNYFPFGMKMTPYLCQSTTDNKYQYNGKEQQTDFGLNWYDYGARFYDPAIGRWHSVDPLAENDRAWSPFNYARNNPIRYIDPDGMEWADPKKDQKIADRLQTGINNRLATENSNLKSANGRVARLETKISEKGSSKGLESRLSNAKDNVASIGITISDLNSSSQELTTMGSKEVAQKFTFNELPQGSLEGMTYKDKDVVKMDIVSDANGVHEATHGYQIYKTGGITNSGRFDAEVSAYQRQFSFNPASVQNIPSDGSKVNIRPNINGFWVTGIYNPDTNKYIYMPGFRK